MINLDNLPRETVDRLMLKESSEPTFENALSEDYTDDCFKTMKARSMHMSQQSYIASIYGMQGGGKSYAALSKCGVLDPRFNINKIFFDVEVLVNERKNILPGTAILVDEMTKVFGVDSLRISIMLNAIKEQLRKKSIHMIYCSPTLKEEYKTSMYVLETMFIDKENKVSYLAYKTNELMTLGYVMIPHPLHFMNKDLLIAYEEKKDQHLDGLLEGGMDAVEDRSIEITKTDFFQKAEKVYLQAKGYIPRATLLQIVEKVFPEFKGSVICYELADRIKANKEISGEWKILGKVEKTTKPKTKPQKIEREDEDDLENEE